MDKAGKTEALEAYKKVFAGAGVVVVTQYSGLTVAEMTDLRVKLKAEGANLKVIKNRLAVIALGGTGGDDAAKLFTGPSRLRFMSAAMAEESTPPERNMPRGTSLMRRMQTVSSRRRRHSATQEESERDSG